MEEVRFNDAIGTLARSIQQIKAGLKAKIVVIRDLYGKLRLAIPESREVADTLEPLFSLVWLRLGVYGSYTGNHILCNEDFFDANLVFNDPDIVDYVPEGVEQSIRLLDRQVNGQDWARNSVSVAHPKRLAFYGLKGGVGRSTALSMAAYHFGNTAKKVLLIDFDLESPGLSGILLPDDRLPEFGITDWFVEDAVGQGESIIPRMAATGSMSAFPGFRGRVDVVPAFGIGENDYLPKLSRVFVDLSRSTGGIERFGDRARRLLAALEAYYQPDIVLIDSRAGLHDLAAVSIVDLADIAFLFATDSPQTWEGYRLLFSFWKARGRTLELVRAKLAVVYALMPERDQDRHLASFLEHSYSLFSETLYQEIPAGDQNGHQDVFNFDLEATNAPHYPITMKWNQGFLDFSAGLMEKGLVDEGMIEICYGQFFKRLDEILESGS